MQTREAVEIRSTHAFELLSTLQPIDPTSELKGPLAYSPDGCSLACVSNTAIMVWDIQTGGVVKDIQCDTTYSHFLMWSLDGRLIGIIDYDQDMGDSFTVCEYDVVLGTTLSSIILQSRDIPCFWAHNESFRVMTTVWDSKACTINIFEVGPTLTKIESFPIQLGEHNYRIVSFSPITYHVSISTEWEDHRLLILDIQNSGRLLDIEGEEEFNLHSFSSDGSLFTASQEGSVHIWKYDNGCYFPWKYSPLLGYGSFVALFSPTSLSILGHFRNALRLWHLDSPSIAPCVYSQPLSIISHHGSRIITAYRQGYTITISNLLLQTPPWFIDTDIEISGLELTGNVLLVVGSEGIVAWLLTEEGLPTKKGLLIKEWLVDDVLEKRRVGYSDSIWTVPIPRDSLGHPMFSVEGEIGVIIPGEDISHIYHIKTGKVLDFCQVFLHLNGPWYSLGGMGQAQNHLYHSSTHSAFPEDSCDSSKITFGEGWIKNHEGKHLMWLPVEWRIADENLDDEGDIKWFSDITTMRITSPRELVVIKLMLTPSLIQL